MHTWNWSDLPATAHTLHDRLCAGSFRMTCTARGRGEAMCWERGHGVDWAYLHPPEVLRGTKYMHLYMQKFYNGITKETQPRN